MFIPPQALPAVRNCCCEGNCDLELAGMAKSVDIVNLNRLKTALKRKGGYLTAQFSGSGNKSLQSWS